MGTGIVNSHFILCLLCKPREVPWCQVTFPLPKNPNDPAAQVQHIHCCFKSNVHNHAYTKRAMGTIPFGSIKVEKEKKQQKR